MNFLESLLQEGRECLVVATVPPPTIRDGQQGAVANARREVSASLGEP